MLGRGGRWPDFVGSQSIYYKLDLGCLTITLEFDCLQRFGIGGYDLVFILIEPIVLKIIEFLVVVFHLFLERNRETKRFSNKPICIVKSSKIWVGILGSISGSCPSSSV